MRARLASLAALAAAMLTAGCNVTEAEAETPTAASGSLLLGQQSYPFAVTTCVRGDVAARREFVIQGHGQTGDGRRFDIQADGLSGRGGRIEMRIKGEGNRAAGIYTAALKPGAISADDSSIAAEAAFLRVAEGGEVSGRFQANCR
jgi:hypothetical protein